MSEIFEAAQMSTNVIARSAFSEEDLPSNTLGFYAEAKGWDREKIKARCDVWDAARSRAVFRGYTFGEERTHKATRLPQGGRWPAAFDDIRPEPEGTGLWKTQFYMYRYGSELVQGR